MDSYLYMLFTGQLNPSESIMSESAEYKAALKKYIEIQKELSVTLTPVQLSLLNELQSQKNLTVACEMFEAFRTGFGIAAGVCFELYHERDLV